MVSTLPTQSLNPGENTLISRGRFEGTVHGLAGGEEGFRHLMLELAAMSGAENEFVRRRWLEENEDLEKTRI